MKGTSVRKCRVCDQELELIRMLDSRTGKLIRMFECQCRERVWDD